MTFTFFGFPRQRASDKPTRPSVTEISVVVPVRDNPRGVERLVQWWAGVAPGARPRELILVDDGSQVPLVAAAPGVRVVRTRGRGPAAARNTGWQAAVGEWIAFTDSDCVPDAGWPASFGWGWDGEVAVQGRVRPMSDDSISLFYDSQQVLRPMAWTKDGRPQYLVSANALVWRAALARLGGFDESFRLAAGEDVELGLRLAEIGGLRWCDEASVAHDFESTVLALVRRFARYGRGNRQLASTTSASGARFKPRPFVPRSLAARDHVFAVIAFASLGAGWLLEAVLSRRAR